ncbi:hypothetical protein PIB30_036812 [Stylosanthes scabra]|uniref:PLATZ transcription factor family protein n=1 Tax=Stylosanthes scabra TaxID=79078 RepID=A0ABU6QD69_9FABA|nr:hypothetical protein [Stylosanthes scabra]
MAVEADEREILRRVRGPPEPQEERQERPLPPLLPLPLPSLPPSSPPPPPSPSGTIELRIGGACMCIPQVRRYVYHDVVRLGDLQKLIDCSNIQPYTINGAKVIFLNVRAQGQSRSSCSRGGSANSCCSCDRILQDPFHFCSLSCKVDHMVYEGERLSSILRRLDESDFSFSQFEGLRVDSSSELVDEDNTQYAPNGSCSNTHATPNNSVISSSCEARNRNKNKSKSNGFFHSLGSRRKGAPHRAPFS